MASVQLKQRPGKNFKPIARAYVLAYLSSTGPKLLSLLISIFRRKRKIKNTYTELRKILLPALRLNSFATFCAVLVGGSSLFQQPISRAILSSLRKFQRGSTLPVKYCRTLVRFLAALLAASISFQLINQSSSVETSTRSTHASTEEVTGLEVKLKRESKIPPGLPPFSFKAMMASPPKIASAVPLAGRSIDLTLFAFIRALDVLLQSSSILERTPSSNRVKQFVSRFATPFMFAASSATIMNAFFYAPYRLPYTYVTWIDRIAECDDRLIRALREARYGNFTYGKDTGIAPLLGSMCQDYGLPAELGDPAKTIPVPCEVVHQGCGPSCEYHALARFWRASTSALGVYVPLQTLVLLRILKNRSMDPSSALRKVSVDAARSSAFLGAFVALFYYGVCLGRTRLGPKLFSYKTITPQMWDGGLCVAVGCVLCGWSVLLEIARRRTELTLFVIPRALGVLFPRKYELQHRWREQITFSLSMAVIFTAAQEKPERVRGVFGKLIHRVLAP